MAPVIVGAIVGLIVVLLGLWVANRIDAGTFHLPLLTLHLRVRRWWRRRQYRFDECEVCEKRSRHNVTLTAERDRSGGGLVGGSSISATFCPEHLPE